jgi:uncharacterized protein (DUF433 family)
MDPEIVSGYPALCAADLNARWIMETRLLGIGLYTVGEASRLSGAPAAQIRRWLRGYRYRHGAKSYSKSPVWPAEIPLVDGSLALSFNDLMEIRFVRAFRDQRIPLQRIRRAIQELSRLYEFEYPFSHQHVVTDGLHLFADLKDESGEPLLYELTGSRNYAFPNIIYPLLRKGLVFDKSGSISQWYPDRERYVDVIVDPTVCFGHAVIHGTRIRPSVLAAAYKAESSMDRVAEWYQIDPVIVRQAVEFHANFNV